MFVLLMLCTVNVKQARLSLFVCMLRVVYRVLLSASRVQRFGKPILCVGCLHCLLKLFILWFPV